MNYIGRKYSVFDFLDEGISDWVDTSCEVFFDAFSGTGVVGVHFKRKGYRIVANDLQYYAYCLNRACVGSSRRPGFALVRKALGIRGADGARRAIGYLNDVRPVRGFIARNYCPGGTGEPKRQYFTDGNGRKIDAIRLEIERWRESGWLREAEYFFLLASLIEAADRVANTASVYAAYLKRIKPSAQRPLQLGPIDIVPSSLRHRVYFDDGLRIARRVKCDILCMDAPYNQRQYCTNYHLLETIAAYDSPSLRGKTGLRPIDGQRSPWCSKVHAEGALTEMLSKTQARYCFLSYNIEGLLRKDQILEVMARYGQADCVERDIPRFRADVDRKNRVYKADRVTEYLFRLRRTAS